MGTAPLVRLGNTDRLEYSQSLFGQKVQTGLVMRLWFVLLTGLSVSCATPAADARAAAPHGAAVRELSGDPILGEMLVMNYRVADLSPRQRAMLDFAVKLTERPAEILEADRQALRDAGFSDRDIWDIASVTAFFNMSNRVAAATDMRPNPEYHGMAR